MAGTNPAGIRYLGDASASGEVWGRSSAGLLAFYGGTPTTRASGTSQAAVAVTGATSSSTIIASLQSVVASQNTLLNEIRDVLVTRLNLMAGA